VIHADFRISTTECSTCGRKLPGFADPLTISPGFLFQSQAGYTTIQTGADLTKFNFIFGLWYRHVSKISYPSDVASIRAGYRVTFSKDTYIRILYSIDLADSKLSDSPVLAHEISLVLFFGKVH
jgi:hypothetical protein